MAIPPEKRCAACNAKKQITRHHYYPKSLREIWEGQYTQVIIYLCEPCHIIVHYPGGARRARRARRLDYLRRFCDPHLQKVLGPCRRVIRELLQESRNRH